MEGSGLGNSLLMIILQLLVVWSALKQLWRRHSRQLVFSRLRLLEFTSRTRCFDSSVHTQGSYTPVSSIRISHWSSIMKLVIGVYCICNSGRLMGSFNFPPASQLFFPENLAPSNSPSTRTIIYRDS